MSTIKKIKFDSEGIHELENLPRGIDWPVVYILENKETKKLYVGETIRAKGRVSEHLKNPDKTHFKDLYLISNDRFNKSAILDIESWLIQYFSADGIYKLENKNNGLKNHEYYDRQTYEVEFEKIWDQVRNSGLALNALNDLKNSDLFKYSPYKTLSDDQYYVAQEIYNSLISEEKHSWIITGGPGTGKTILAIYLIKYILGQKKTEKMTVGLVIPMTALRKSIRKVFRNVEGLSASMVLGPNDVCKKEYDILFVDEAHRLKQRKNLAHYPSFDGVNKKLGLPVQATQFDWIKACSRQQVLFYDPNQSVTPADIPVEHFEDYYAKAMILKSQMRVEGGEDYMKFIENIFEPENAKPYKVDKYSFEVHDKLSSMITTIKHHNKSDKLSRIVAGYAWKWVSRGNPNMPDICIEDQKLFWNSTLEAWPNSQNAINEVGCIHTVQGYDLSHVGVIIGPEIDYDPETNRIVIYPERYHDFNGKRSLNTPDDLKKYIINIYKTLMTRGIKGVHLYICNKNLKDYISGKIIKE